jgi:TRAP-type C4-dicarboxylate transport system permease small subunit
MKNVFKQLEELLGCVFLIIFVGLTIVNVVLRYCFNFILPWAEEGILIAFSWCVFLGVIRAFRADRHVAIDVVVNRFPPGPRKAVAFGVEILVLALNLFMTYLGVVLCLNVGVKSTYVLRISFVYIDMAIVIAFGVMSIFGAFRLILRLTGRYKDIDSVTRVINEVSEEAKS